MPNKLLTPDEAIKGMIESAKKYTKDDERAAMTLLGCCFGMAGKPPKADLDYLAKFLEKKP